MASAGRGQSRPRQADDALGSALGLPTNQQAIAGHKAYVSGQEAQGHVPGKIGEFAGEVAGTIPVALATKNPWLAGAASGALTTNDPNDLKQPCSTLRQAP
jgi:hypothetical protein